MARSWCENISLLPTTEDYYAEIDTDKLVFLFVDVVLTAIIFIVFAEECYFVVKTYRHFDIAVKSIWLISIYPVFALLALLSVTTPRASFICDFVSTCYLSACIFQFSSLLLLYFGHVDLLLLKIKDTGFSLRPRPCCCCVCCPVLPPTRKGLVTVRLLVFQTAVLQPIIQFISAVLWADGKFYTYGIDFTQAYTYLTILKLASTVTAIYGLNALHTSTHPYLLTHNTKPKQLALQLVLVFSNLQAAILSIPARFNIPRCSPKHGLSSQFQMRQWHHLVLVVEMFLLSVMARVYYRRPLTLDAILEAQSGNLADIYSPNIVQKQTDADSAQSKDSSEGASLPQDELSSPCDGENTLHKESLQQRPADRCMSDENGTFVLNVESDEFHIINNNDVDDITGTVNPVCNAETLDNDETELQNKTAFDSEEECSTNLYDNDEQSTDQITTSESQSSADDDMRHRNGALNNADCRQTTATLECENGPVGESTDYIDTRL